MSETVILVDEKDNAIGTAEKISAHRNGQLHRAISVLVFNGKGEMLIQQRAAGKYHWPGIWANTCCSHPRPGETAQEAAERRLREEMGFTCDLGKLFVFTYRAEYDNGLIENEIDHVFSGVYDGQVMPNPAEVQDYAWKRADDIRKQIDENPEKYAPWFRIILERIKDA